MKKPKAARALTPELLQQQFDLIVRAALNHQRCPVCEPYGPIIENAIKRMRALGWVDWEVGYRGWRQATILVGPHAGKVTAPNPREPAPQKIRAPSAPRPLTSQELER